MLSLRFSTGAAQSARGAQHPPAPLWLRPCLLASQMSSVYWSTQPRLNSSGLGLGRVASVTSSDRIVDDVVLQPGSFRGGTRGNAVPIVEKLSERMGTAFPHARERRSHCESVYERTETQRCCKKTKKLFCSVINTYLHFTFLPSLQTTPFAKVSGSLHLKLKPFLFYSFGKHS